MTITTRPLTPAIGVEITGLDLAGPIDDETMAEVRRAWLDHVIAVFPEQEIDDDSQIAFSRRIGELELINMSALQVKGRPELYAATNIDENGVFMASDHPVAQLNKDNQRWHSDSSFKRVPAMASLLRACQVPSEGGETEFADMRAAYDELDGELRDRLDDKIAVHSYGYSQSQVGGMKALSEDEWNAVPPVEHPVIRTHPATARKNLYIGRHASHIKGEDVEESRSLLISLCEDACRAPRTYKHSWRPGDLVIWDNRCVLHRGHGYPGDQPRVMVRTTVAGEEAGNEWTL